MSQLTTQTQPATTQPTLAGMSAPAAGPQSSPTLGELLTPYPCPFTIITDSQEKHPFTFGNLLTDSEHDYRPLTVRTTWQSLGNGMGDYSIIGGEGRVHVERKSAGDAHGTFLGFNTENKGDDKTRRDRFEVELTNLATVEAAAVVVECSRGHLIRSAPAWGRKSADENAKILFRQIMAWEMDYRVPFVFCDDRRLAEIYTFRFLWRYWEKRMKVRRDGDESKRWKFPCMGLRVGDYRR